MMELVKTTDDLVSDSIDSIVGSVPIAEPLTLFCLNGPCKDSTVNAPIGVVPGIATAIKWRTVNNADRYAVYVVVEHRGLAGLMYIKSYNKPFQAQQRVKQITGMVAAGVS